ncbi:MAG: A/G-specific adenine glycosylase [Actinomycetota bacterium]
MARRPAALLDWYAPRRRAFPWRRTRDPYRILVSEVMLQQTQAARVARAFPAFLRRFPSLRALARATRAEVVAAWDGLGYNRRALALAECARAVARDHGGRLPRDVATLRTLPGVGPYTAAAVASIAFGEPVPALDVNVRRVVARWRLGAEPDAVDAVALEAAARRAIDRADPGAWNQALMDVGREHCRPRPRCAGCPLASGCRHRRAGAPRATTRRPTEPFEGSRRQVRGAVVRALREGGASVGTLEARTGFPAARLGEAIAGLVRDGLVTAGPAARAGARGGRVRLRD